MQKKKKQQQQQDQQLAKQKAMRHLLHTKADICNGFALGGIAFYEPKHKDSGCFCEQGFLILQGSFNLASWTNQTIEEFLFNLVYLIKNDHVSRMSNSIK